jgi:PAS domain S-box-containing protein
VSASPAFPSAALTGKAADRFAACVPVLALFVLATGLVVLSGWALDVASLKSVLPGAAAMKPNTAFAFVAAGLALWFLRGAAVRKRVGQASAALALAIGLVTLGEYAFGWQLGIDQLLFRDALPSVGATYPRRMSLNTALSFVFAGSALLLLDAETRRNFRPAEWLALAAALVSFLALLGFIYGVEALLGIGPYASMAFHSVVTFLVLAAGILCARPHRGLMGMLTSNTVGGVMARRLLPAVILLPPLLGWLRTLGQQAGWYEAAFGRALLVASMVVVFTIIIWRTVALLNRVDAERIASQVALRTGQQLLQAIIDNAPAVVYAKDLEGHYLLINRRYAELFHVTSDAVLGRTDFDLFDPDAAAAFRAMDERVAARGVALTEEEIAPQDDGLHTYISVKCPLRDTKGEIYAVFGISTDITERKHAEVERTALLGREQAAREEAEALNEVARALASELNLQQIVQAATDAATRLTGAQFGAFFYNVLDGKGESYLLYTLSGAPREAFEKFGLPRNTAIFEPTFRGTGPVRLADVQTDPRYGRNPPHQGMPQGHLPVRSYLAVPVLSRGGAVLGGLFFGHPEPAIFTERAERVALGIAAQAAVAIDNTRLYQDARDSAARLAAQVTQLRLLDQITRAIGQRQDLASLFQVVLCTLEESLPIDFGCVCLHDAESGSLIVTRVGSNSQPFAQEMALAEHTPIAIDANGLARCVSGQLVYEPDIASSPFAFPQRLARAGLRALVVAPLLVENKVFGILVAARRQAQGFSSVDCEFLRQLSEHVGLASQQMQLYGALQRAYDELRLSQQTVLQQERLRALGQMASGIAHDINNAISPAALYTQSLLEREPALSERTRTYLTTIQRAIEDVAQTVARMREFYRPREAQLVLSGVDLNRVVREVIDLTHARWSDMPQERGIVISLECELTPDLPRIMGAESEIRDSLTNLIFNAVDAMPHGGTLRLRTRTIRTAQDEETARSVAVEVSDTGVGMDEETRRRCLEPFFTTKGERGTGLGLAMVYGMIQRHSAELDIESAPGRGTTVRIMFPVPFEDMAATAHLNTPVVPVRPLRILLVDDDPMLLRSLADVLEGDGHAVTATDGGQAGIDTFLAAQKGNEPFAVVVTDLGMPYVDGRKVAAAVRSASPHTPILLLTGWGQRLLADEDIPAHVNRVLSKPPKLHELRTALAELAAGQV